MLIAQFEGASEQCPFLSYYIGEGLKKSPTVYSFICL